jgi:hypothetical protein
MRRMGLGLSSQQVRRHSLQGTLCVRRVSLTGRGVYSTHRTLPARYATSARHICTERILQGGVSASRRWMLS